MFAVLSARALSAQDETKPMVLGGFENQGSATVGYRFTDVSGYRPKYQELQNLNSGFRLLDFELFGKAQPGANRFADNYSFVSAGVGGDPFVSQHTDSPEEPRVRPAGEFPANVLLLESQ
ncbi:MAG: hypothetical protein WDO18_23375 [Acidobacteriota bacterium]